MAQLHRKITFPRIADDDGVQSRDFQSTGPRDESPVQWIDENMAALEGKFHCILFLLGYVRKPNPGHPWPLAFRILAGDDEKRIV